MNNRLAQEALKQAASRAKAGLRQGADALVERETAPLRARVAELEARVARLERLVGGHAEEAAPPLPGGIGRDDV